MMNSDQKNGQPRRDDGEDAGLRNEEGIGVHEEEE